MNKNPYLLPISILIAGVIVAGAIIYRPTGSGGSANLLANTVKKLDFTELANELGLDQKAFKTCLEDRAFKDEVEKDLAAGVSAGVNGTPATFINGQLIEGAYPFEAYQAAIESALAGDKTATNDPKITLPTIDDDAVLGDANAPVSVIIFGDYQCPFCEQAYSTAEKQIREEYLKNGKVKMVFRDFPLSFHASATPAAEAAQCAGAQGKYWEYHDALFENQDRL